MCFMSQRSILWDLRLRVDMKFCRGNSCFIITWQECRVLYMKTHVYLWQYLLLFFLEWKICQAQYVRKIIIHFRFKNNFFFFEKCAFYEIIWKSMVGHIRKYNAAQRRCYLHTAKLSQEYRYTPVIFKSYSFSMGKWSREGTSTLRGPTLK